MTFKLSQSGAARIAGKLSKLQSVAPRMVREVWKQANVRHSRKFRARFIPIDTGRMQASFRGENGPDRELIVQPKRMSINSLVPYAIKQWYRVPPVTKQDLNFIFTEPMVIKINGILEGRE